jgi:hypothetical protein
MVVERERLEAGAKKDFEIGPAVGKVTGDAQKILK